MADKLRYFNPTDHVILIQSDAGRDIHIAPLSQQSKHPGAEFFIEGDPMFYERYTKCGMLNIYNPAPAAEPTEEVVEQAEDETEEPQNDESEPQPGDPEELSAQDEDAPKRPFLRPVQKPVARPAPRTVVRKRPL